MVVLNYWPTIKEALDNQAENFNGRPKNVIYDDLIHYSGANIYENCIASCNLKILIS